MKFNNILLIVHFLMVRKKYEKSVFFDENLHVFVWMQPISPRKNMVGDRFLPSREGRIPKISEWRFCPAATDFCVVLGSKSRFFHDFGAVQTCGGINWDFKGKI
jgi:hypothetical protein